MKQGIDNDTIKKKSGIQILNYRCIHKLYVKTTQYHIMHCL